MSIAFRSIALGQSSSVGGTSVQVAKPSDVAAGDVLVFVIQSEQDQAFATFPAGFTEFAAVGVGGAELKLGWKRATASEPTTYTATLASPDQWSAAVIAFSDPRQVGSPVDVAGGEGTFTDGTITAASVTTTVPTTLLVGVWGKGAVVGTTIPAPMTPRAQFQAANPQHTLVVATEPRTSAGATGSRILTTDSYAANGAGVLFAVAENTPPNAPVLNFPAAVNVNATVRLPWDFADTDPGDSQSAAEIRYRETTTSTWTTVSVGNPNQFWDAVAGTFAAGVNYESQVRTADAGGVWGPWATSAFFDAVEPPPGPTWLDPVDGQTVDGDSYTGVISIADADASEWTLYADNAGAIDETTVVQGPVEVTSGDVRRHTFTGLTNDVPIWWSVRVQDNGLWSEPVQIRTPVSYTPPTPATLSLVTDEDSGSIAVSITNPALGGATVAYNDLYVRESAAGGDGIRVATMLSTNSTWRWWLPASGVDYEFQAVAVAVNGTTIASGWVGASTEPVDYYYGGAFS